MNKQRLGKEVEPQIEELVQRAEKAVGVLERKEVQLKRKVCLISHLSQSRAGPSGDPLRLTDGHIAFRTWAAHQPGAVIYWASTNRPCRPSRTASKTDSSGGTQAGHAAWSEGEVEAGVERARGDGVGQLLAAGQRSGREGTAQDWIGRPSLTAAFPESEIKKVMRLCSFLVLVKIANSAV